MPTVNSASDAFLQLWAGVIVYLHNILGAIVWLIVGYIVARIVRTVLVKVLQLVHFDQIVDRGGIGRALQATGTRLDAAGVLGLIAFWWIFLMFIENAVTALGINTLTSFINELLAYVPNIFAAVLIVFVGALIANVVADIARGAAAGGGPSMVRAAGGLARWAILLFAVLTALTQLRVGATMIYILFAGIVTLLAIAGGIAFGLGGVDAARNLVNSQSSQAAGALSQQNANQQTQQTQQIRSR
ncbi:MAG: hypothetical protein LC769_09420 [Chloroflexi bacterium]|nr:hypothetical protein [Chloroflexota bacterium]